MSQATLFIVPSLTLVILLAVAFLVRMMRVWRLGDEVRTLKVHRDRIALEDEKHRLLVTVQDLQIEHELGKLTDADYLEMKKRFEEEAVAVIEQLEES